MGIRPKPYSISTFAGEAAANIDEMFEILFADLTNTGVFADTAIGAANTVLRSNGTAVVWSKVVLTTDVSGILGFTNGGTGSAATPTAGGAAYGTGSALAWTAAGVSGQVLTSNGAAAPTWQASSGGGSTGAGYYEPISNGDAANPELVFSGTGDVISVFVHL